MLVFPKNFPHHYGPPTEKRRKSLLSQLVKKPDALGAFLLLGASILIVAALAEGGVRFAWNSAIIITFFTVSGLLWLAFFLWEWFASREGSEVEPMFPARFFSNRMWMGTLLGCFLSGAPLTIAVIELPQRYQIINDSSPLNAGVKLLAYAAACPVGVVMASMATGRLRFPFVWVMLVGCTLQVVGFALMSTLPTYLEAWNGQYGYSVIAGLGTGANIGALYMLAPIVVDKKDQGKHTYKLLLTNFHKQLHLNETFLMVFSSRYRFWSPIPYAGWCSRHCCHEHRPQFLHKFSPPTTTPWRGAIRSARLSQ